MSRNVQITLRVLAGEPQRSVARSYKISQVRVREIFWKEVWRVAPKIPRLAYILSTAPATHRLGITRAHNASISEALEKG